MNTRRKLGHKVSPRSRNEIVNLATYARDALGITTAKVSICGLLERLQHQELLELEIVEDFVLDKDEAQAYPDKNLIKIKNSVYDAACDGQGHARFTLAHELGHILLHKNQQASYARGDNHHKIYEDSEWQADTFASAFLMDERFIDRARDTTTDLMNRFGTSHEAAAVRLSKK